MAVDMSAPDDGPEMPPTDTSDESQSGKDEEVREQAQKQGQIDLEEEEWDEVKYPRLLAYFSFVTDGQPASSSEL